MSLRSSITAAMFERILAFLTPLFLGSGTSDTGPAREAARETLSSYGARTNRELRLAALCIAFSFGALDALSRAANPELPMSQMMRLRGNANALNRAAQQNENRLEKLLKQPSVAAEAKDAVIVTEDAPVDVLPASSATADLLAFARSKLKSMMSGPTAATPALIPVAPLSRQQRRDVERKTEKVRRRQQEEARRAQRTAQRSATVSEVARQSVHA
jgi:hypothetical protein